MNEAVIHVLKKKYNKGDKTCDCGHCWDVEIERIFDLEFIKDKKSKKRK